jgi:hypothetical protein
MSAPVYSVAFLSAHGVVQDTVWHYDFPEGDYTYVMVHMDAFFTGAGANQLIVYDNHLTTFWQEQGTFEPGGDWEQWQGRQVFAPGDWIEISVQTFDIYSHVDWRASGYALTGLVPFPVAVISG